MDETIHRRIVEILDRERIMTLATVRPDGWPQATTVGYVNDGLSLYFLCVTPTVVSVLDYRQGFGHTDLVSL